MKLFRLDCYLNIDYIKNYFQLHHDFGSFFIFLLLFIFFIFSFLLFWLAIWIIGC